VHFPQINYVEDLTVFKINYVKDFPPKIHQPPP